MLMLIIQLNYRGSYFGGRKNNGGRKITHNRSKKKAGKEEKVKENG